MSGGMFIRVTTSKTLENYKKLFLFETAPALLLHYLPFKYSHIRPLGPGEGGI